MLHQQLSLMWLGQQLSSLCHAWPLLRGAAKGTAPDNCSSVGSSSLAEVEGGGGLVCMLHLFYAVIHAQA